MSIQSQDGPSAARPLITWEISNSQQTSRLESNSAYKQTFSIRIINDGFLEDNSLIGLSDALEQGQGVFRQELINYFANTLIPQIIATATGETQISVPEGITTESIVEVNAYHETQCEEFSMKFMNDFRISVNLENNQRIKPSVALYNARGLIAEAIVDNFVTNIRRELSGLAFQSEYSKSRMTLTEDGLKDYQFTGIRKID